MLLFYFKERKLTKVEALSQRKRVLFLDDGDLVRDSLRELLESLGYKVETAPDGEMAYKLFEESLRAGQPYDFVVLTFYSPKNGLVLTAI